MGLPALTLTQELAEDWQTILRGDGLNVSQQETGEAELAEVAVVKRVAEVLWRVKGGGAELIVLEAIFRDRSNGNVVLIFMFPRTDSERKLLSHVQCLLVAAGAVVIRK